MDQNRLDLAHDLRMPLQIICSCAQLIRDAPEDGPAARRYADMMLDSVRLMERMLSGALEGARPGPEPVPPRRADLVRCVRTLCQRCQPRAAEKDVRLCFGANVSALETALDEDALSRALLNLISNALRFTLPGGEIRVSLTALGDFAEIAVADNGCGIPPEKLPWIFLRGESEGGHGYGLPIVQACARQLGGEVEARSEPGKGSTFTLRLPLRAAEAAS